MLAYRLVENQTKLYSYEVTDTDDQAEALDSMIQETRPKAYSERWHILLEAPFCHPLPIGPTFSARFRPPGSFHNILYSSEQEVTCLYEHTFHYLSERVHFDAVPETARRTVFQFEIIDPSISDLSVQAGTKVSAIMNRRSYAESHKFIEKHPSIKVLSYPSCRDPNQRRNFAVFDINSLKKKVRWERAIALKFQPGSNPSVTWIDYNGKSIRWDEINWNTAAT